MHLQSLLNNKTVLSVLFLSLSSTALAQGNNEFGYPVAPDTTSSINAPVGSIDGSFSVSATGGATYTIPIEVPKGVADSEPNLAITYNSQSGNGVAGFGCGISGVSVITRVPTDIYHDGTATGIDYGTDGQFCLDGQRLVQDGDIMNGDSLRYHLELDPFTEVVLHGLSSSSSHSQILMWFSVRTPDGMYREYGKEGNSIQIIYNFFHFIANSWYLSSETNPRGITRSYSYVHWDNSLYLQTVSYGDNVVRFEYEQRPDTIKGAVKGEPVLISKRLSSVTSATIVGENDSIFRRYTLQYVNSDQSTTGFSRLNQVRAYNGRNESMLPTVFSWNGLSAYSITKDTLTIPNLYERGGGRNDLALASADLNGDGLTDIIKMSTNHPPYSDGFFARIHYASRNANGDVSFTPGELFELPDAFDMGFCCSKTMPPTAMDVDGDGLAEVLVPVFKSTPEYNNCGYYAYKNGAWIGGVIYTDLHATEVKNYLWSPADFDNNGISEMLVVEKVKDNGTVNQYYASIIGGYNNQNAYNRPLRLCLPSVPRHVFTVDMNNDGLSDIVVFHDSGYSVFRNNGGWLNSGTSTPLVLTATTYSLQHAPDNVWPGDFNGDGIVDFLISPCDNFNFYFEFGNGNGGCTEELACTLSIYDESATDDDDDTFFCQVFDMDGDGKSDVVIHKAMYYDASSVFEQSYYEHDMNFVYWMRSNGHQLVQQAMAYIGVEIEKEARFYTLGDYDGDGLQEVAALSFDCYSDHDDSNDVRFRIYRNSAYSPSCGKIASVTDAFGNINSVSYTTTADPDAYSVGSNQNDPGFPVSRITSPIPVVKKMTGISDGTPCTVNKYQYGDLLYHMQGRGLLGIRSYVVEDSISGLTTSTSTDEWHSTAYLPTHTTETQTLGGQTSTKETAYIIKTQIHPHTYWQVTDSISKTDFDGYHSKEGFSYHNAYGKVWTHYIHAGGYDEYSCYDNYVFKGGQYLPGLVYHVNEHPDDPDYYETYTHYAYNSKGLVDTLVTFFGTDKAQKTIYTYDAYGNPLRKKIMGGGITLTTDTWQYDPSHRFVTKHVENGITDTRYTHDLWGNILTETDSTRTAHPLTQTYTYDGWGRMVTELSPVGLLTKHKTGWGTQNGYKYYSLSMGAGMPWVKTWYNARGRKVKMESIGALNIDLTDTWQYNNIGELIKHTKKRGNITTIERFAYDTRGRVISDTLTDSSGVLFKALNNEYGNNWKRETRNGITTTTTYDRRGKEKSISTSQDTVTYIYNSQDKPVSVTSCGHTVTMEYDITGNQIRLVDPDAGTMSYTYDGLGRISSQTNAKNQTQNFTYDSNGRKKTAPKGGVPSVTYTYGTTTGNKGLLLSEAVGSQWKISYQYDNYGRVTLERRSPHRHGSRDFNFTYNNLGQVATQTYPNGITVSYQYDAYGNHVGTMRGDTVIWRLETSTGSSTQWQLGPSFHKQTTVNAMGQPTAKTLRYGNTSLRAMTFTYNNSTGNLTQRTGMLAGVAENFTYDAQERLTGTTCGSGSQSFTYAANGNITSKTDIGDYYYEGAKPHAVTSIDNDHWLVPDRRQTITYNVMGKATSIKEVGKDTLTINYGGDGERWKSVQKNHGNQLTTLYFGDYEERTDSMGTESICYLDGGVMIIHHIDGTERLYVPFTDHLGSYLDIYNENAQSKFRATYDAWGRQTVHRNDISFHRGYTGHEMLPEFGLINMNGRLYDPLLGRFLSTDDYVQAPFDSQSFNRYSYCLNNPLKYTDPDGEVWWIVGAALIGGAINLGFKAYNGQIHSFWDGVAAFGIGAAAGAAGAATGGWAFAAAGGAAGGVGGFLAGFASGVAGSAVALPMENLGNHTYFGDPIMSGKEYLTGIAISGAIGGAVNGFSAIKNNRSFISGQPKANVEITLRKVDPVSVTSDYPLTLRKESDNINWPNPDYVDGTKVNYTITEGTHLDRYAFDITHANNGKYFSTPDVPFEMRSLPYTKENYKHFEYKVIKPLPGTKSLARPYFNQPGLGFQFQAHPIPGTVSIPSASELEKAGYIKLIIINL